MKGRSVASVPGGAAGRRAPGRAPARAALAPLPALLLGCGIAGALLGCGIAGALLGGEGLPCQTDEACHPELRCVNGLCRGGVEPIGARALACGGQHTCALLVNGDVKCWGYNGFGQLGYGDSASRGDHGGEMGDALPVVDLGTAAKTKQIAAGYWHTCALLDSGEVKCWGNNWYGQLGLGDRDHRGDEPGEMGDLLPAVDLGPGSVATAIATRGFHSCALLLAGSVKCWGHNGFGQLGSGDREDRGDDADEMGEALPAVALAGELTAQLRRVSAGMWHTCAEAASGAVQCWGRNRSGQLGLCDGDHRGDDEGEMGEALPQVDLGAGRSALQVEAGGFHTCALLADHDLKCWGRNAYGELGLGDQRARGNLPGAMGDDLATVELGPGRGCAAVATGLYHTCALLDDGGVLCWGNNRRGQLGIGDTEDRGDDAEEVGAELRAVELGAADRAAAIAAGEDHTCALLEDQSVRCWGGNSLGQLGLGDDADRGDRAGEPGGGPPGVDLGSR